MTEKLEELNSKTYKLYKETIQNKIRKEIESKQETELKQKQATETIDNQNQEKEEER